MEYISYPASEILTKLQDILKTNTSLSKEEILIVQSKLKECVSNLFYAAPWSPEDVLQAIADHKVVHYKEIENKITKEDLVKVLIEAEKRYDSSYGMSWEILGLIANEMLEEGQISIQDERVS